MSSCHVFATIAAVSLVLATQGSALADDPLAKPANAEARDRLTAGNRLYRVREFAKAVEEYKAGSLKEDAPVFLYNLGQCYRQLGKYEDAIWHYERFLDRARPTGEMKDAVEGFVKQMKDELAKKARSQPPLEPGPTNPPPASTKPVTIIERGAPWYRDPIGWGLAGVGAVGVGVSLGFVMSAKNLDDQANAEQHQSVRDDLHGRASTRRTTGTILAAVGGAALVAGIVKLYVRPGDRERTVVGSLAVGVAPDGIAVFGRF